MSWIDASQGPAGERMARVAGRLNAALAEFCELLVEADRAQEWLADGAPNVVQWLTARFGIEAGFGRHLTRLSHRLDSLPELSKRFAAGELSLDAVELLAEVATPETELELIEDALGGDLAAIARSASRRKGLTAEESQMEREAEWFSTQWDLQHRKTRMAGELTGMDAQLVEDRLVEGAKKTPKNPETETYDDWNKRMADALVEVCATEGGNAPVPVLTVHADLAALTEPEGDGVSELGMGPVVANETAPMLACDADVEIALSQDHRVVGVGRKQRKVPGWLRRQVEARDHHCQFPGCGRTALLQVHHLQHWAEGGPTDLDNLVLLCWWHHLFIHEHRWHITRDHDHRFVFRRPGWTPYPPRPT
jgi:hypothetical protein